MRISCEYRTEALPIAYNMMFVSLIKEALKAVDAEYLEKLYVFEGKGNKQIKGFCFSVYFNNFKLNNEVLEIDDKISFNISTSDYKFFLNLYNGLIKINEFSYKDKYKLRKIKIKLINEKNINSEQIVFKTLSPIYMKDKNNNALAPMEEEYVKELNYIINTTLECCRGYGLKRPIEFENVLMKKRVVKENIREFKNETDKDIFYVNSYTGVFKLTGDIEDLRDVYVNGIGFRRSQGFGMIEVV